MGDEQIAPCGHPERFWKVEVNQEAWCVMCHMEKLALERGILIDKCKLWIKYERQALLDDDPWGACAGSHRGTIRAFQAILKYLGEEDPTKDPNALW